MFNNKKEVQEFDDVDIKIWATELVLSSYLAGKTDKALSRQDIVSIIDFSNMLVGFVHYDILPEEINDEV